MVYLNITAAHTLIMIEQCREMNLLLDWNDFLSCASCIERAVPHQREILGRTCIAAMNHIEASAGTPLDAAAHDGVWSLTRMILLAARPHSCQLYSFYGLLPLTWPPIFYLPEPARGKICPEWGITHIILQLNPLTTPHLSFHTHTHTHISSCHLGSDTRGIGLWQKIHTADRWVLLCLTGEKIEGLKERGGGKDEESGGGGREEDEEGVDARRACLCTVVCMSVYITVPVMGKRQVGTQWWMQWNHYFNYSHDVHQASGPWW